MSDISSTNIPSLGEEILRISDIRALVLEEDPETRKKLQRAETTLRSNLALTPPKGERRLEILFYCLVIKLRLFAIETPEMARLYRELLSELQTQIELGRQLDTPAFLSSASLFERVTHHFSTINHRLSLLQDRIRVNQMKAFLYVAESYVHTLERFYKEKSMSDRILELYVQRMNIKKDRYFFNREFGLYFGFGFFRAISSYGTSFGRLAITCSLSIILFWSIYWLADAFAPENVRMIGDLTDYSSYLFNSLVTISGLGIDASPQTALQRVAMGINTIYGMVVFGMLFNVISTKLSMNN